MPLKWLKWVLTRRRLRWYEAVAVAIVCAVAAFALVAYTTLVLATRVSRPQLDEIARLTALPLSPSTEMVESRLVSRLGGWTLRAELRMDQAQQRALAKAISSAGGERSERDMFGVPDNSLPWWQPRKIRRFLALHRPAGDLPEVVVVLDVDDTAQWRTVYLYARQLRR